MLSEAGLPLYLFEEGVGFVEKHAGHTFQKGVTQPHQETLIKGMQQKVAPRARPSIIIDAKIQSPYKPGHLNR
jgi:hypothetical protein